MRRSRTASIDSALAEARKAIFADQTDVDRERLCSSCVWPTGASSTWRLTPASEKPEPPETTPVVRRPAPAVEQESTPPDAGTCAC